MDPASGIRKLGFRKWYERQLLESHAALVTCLLCGIGIAALVEAVNVLEVSWASVSMLPALVGAAALAWATWRRYITVLERAERYGERSVCPSCGTYGRFEVVASGVEHPADVEARAPLPFSWLRVRCRRCGTGWRIPD